ncbi:MAG: hypothetical protein HRU23_00765 [Gammaproteobacteria bacterium]|nr:hypothetical protein [Gammaproteobacteria bacterium]
MFSNNYGTYRGFIRSHLDNVKNKLGYYQAQKDLDWSKVKRLVFVCQGNICRSSYAHYLALQNTDKVASLGYATTTGQAANEVAAKVAMVRGVDLSQHLTTDLTDFIVSSGDLFLVMEDRHLDKITSVLEHSDVQVSLLGLFSSPSSALIYDPFTHSEAYFNSCFNRIDSAVNQVVTLFANARSS